MPVDHRRLGKSFISISAEAEVVKAMIIGAKVTTHSKEETVDLLEVG